MDKSSDKTPKKIAIWWIRRDFRLTDNQALRTALTHGDQIIPIFVLDPALLNSPYVGEKRIAFLFEGLRRLDIDLRRRSSSLVVRSGKPAKILADLVSETKAGVIFAEEDYTPYARKRDHQISQILPLELTPGLSVHHPRTIIKKDGNPYEIFTPFSRAWKILPKPNLDELFEAPNHIPSPGNISYEAIPDHPRMSQNVPFIPGEKEAKRLIKNFTQGENAAIYRYQALRNRPDLNATSQLSPFLRFGMISSREIVATAYQAIHTAPDKQSRDNAVTWLNELIWREFFQAVIYHFPYVRQTSFNKNFRRIHWANNPEDFDAWCIGKTGYPIVDAGMRQLSDTGWMHNRVRMITASFLTKDLLINWQNGETWFMKHLIDGDPAANNGGWQWAAGTGTDAAPYFRIFNPIIQSKKFDPDGNYIRRWIPELQSVPNQYIHTPWEMPHSEQKKYLCIIGEDYPAPIIDHAWARTRALAVYQNSKELQNKGKHEQNHRT